MYTDENLQDHEFDFWSNYWNSDWVEKVKDRNNNFVLPFFESFKDASYPILEIGSGGFPISQMVDIEVAVCDPLHDKLKDLDIFHYLKDMRSYSCPFFEMGEQDKFNTIICLNCLDHFNNNEYFFEKASNLLNVGGKIYLFYHLRNEDRDDHLAIDQKSVELEISKRFTIYKESKESDPNVGGWADGAVRYILIKN